MVLKKRTVHLDAEKLADQLADKPYGEEKAITLQTKAVNRSISLPESLIIEVEDIILKNKRNKEGARTFSALVKELLEDYTKR